MTGLDIAVLLAYVGGVLVLGWAVSRRIGSFRDWFVAGGQLTTPLLVCTLVSTYYGLDVLLGGSEVAFIDGVVAWFWYVRPYYLAIILAAVFVAHRLKRYDFLSLPDVAAHHYGRGTQTVIALASFLYSLPLLAIMGLGVLLDVAFGLPFVWGVVLGAAVSVVYTLMGGLVADALTDTVQFTLMCVTLAIAAAIVLEAQGGIDAMRTSLPETYFQPMGSYPGWVLFVFGLSALSVFVEPAFYQRIFAATSYRAVLAALGIGVVLWAAFDWIVTVLGIAAAAAGVDTEPRYALLTLVIEALPAGLAGLFAAGVVATAMSTIDSYLLISGGNIAYDLYRPWRRPDIDDRSMLRLTRWAVLLAAIVSVALALFFRSIVSAWIFMSTMLISAALVPVLVALWLPGRVRPAAGLASSLAGLGSALLFFIAVNAGGATDEEWGTVIWNVRLLGRELALWQEYAVLVALPVSMLAFLLGHWLGAPPREARP